MNRPALMGEIQKQLAAAPWLKWGLLAVGALAFLFAWQALAKARSQAEAEAINAEAQLRRVRALQGQDIWTTRQQEAASLYRSLDAEIPLVATPGLAQAALQTWLRGLGNSTVGATDLRIVVDEAVLLEEPAGLIRVHASFSGRMAARQSLNIVRQIEAGTNLVVPETIDIRSGTNNTLNLTVNAYYRSGQGKPE